jgi:probable F420-dependent oxidoreductase
MPRVDLGRTGAVLSPAEPGFAVTAARLEALGYEAIWLTGGPMSSLDQVADVVRATKRVKVITAVIAVVRFGVPDVAALYRQLDAEFPGRFVLGLGGAHGPDPMNILTAYLDELDGVPTSSLVLAALGPRMLRLAAQRAAGALPVLVTPTYTARARSELGPDTTLAIEQLAVVETDPQRARAVARGPLGFLGQLPAYQANFRRMGFSDDDISAQSDHLVDELIVWGDVATIAARVEAHRRSGADHVALSVLTTSPDTPALAEWEALAGVLLPR